MKQSAKHSPTPWSIEHYSSNTDKLLDADGEFVHFVHKSRMEWTDDDPTGAANVDFIVRACNAHDELLAALRAMIDPQNFRTDPTIETLRKRDRAIFKARAILGKVDNERVNDEFLREINR
jgi:hypothetical protein